MINLVHPRSRAFLAYFGKAYPARTALMVILQVVSGVLEGISVITLVPLLEVASTPNAEASSGLGLALQNGIRALGLEPSLEILVGVLVVGITFKAILLWLAMRQVGFTVARVAYELRLEMVAALLKAKWSYIGSQAFGGFAASITGESNRAATAYREACVMLGGLLQVVMYLVISALISWEVTVAALAAGFLLVRGLRKYVSLGRTAGEEQTRHTLSMARAVVEAMQGIKPMKAMAREHLFWPLLKGEADGLNRAHQKNILASESIRLFQEPIITLVLGAGLVVLLTIADRSFSSIIVLAFVFYRMMTSVSNLQMRYQLMVAGESAFWMVREHIDEAKAHEEQSTGSLIPARLSSSIELRSVSFSYGDLIVLHNLSIEIPAGRITALVGPSGCGKTTILDLITGLRRPSAGEVYVDDVPLAELDLSAWRQQIGYVPQEVFLFHDTVRENVTLGDASISDERVEQALKDSGAWDFITRDPAGINAIIAPQGSNLSGGQRQRLAIARALVRNPALIVLDEATSGLDSETEAAILDTLAALRGRVTILAISHQPALRETADLTIQLDRGGIVRLEEGPVAV